MSKDEAVNKIIGELRVISEWLEAEGKTKSSEVIDCGIIYLQELEKIYKGNNGKE